MKTIFIIILFLFCVFSNAQNTDNGLEADIRGRDCKGGLSLCTVEISANKTSTSPKYTLAKISETEIQLNINIKALTIEEQKTLFGKLSREISEEDNFYFNQDYDFELNKDCIEVLGISSKNPIIKNGNYPIRLINDEAKVILKLSNKI